MLKELNKQLARFTNPVKAEMTPEEMEAIKQMFLVEGGYEALYKFMLIENENDKGVSLAYDIENLPSVAQGFTKEDIADIVMFNQTMTRHIRSKFDSLKQEFVENLKAEISELEKTKAEEKLKNAEKIQAQKQEEIGVGINA